MLQSLSLRDWKSFGAHRNKIELGKLTLLVGPNGSGKSNALDGLRFLQGAALDFPLGDVLRGRWEGQREIWPAIRGHVVEAARGGCQQFELRTEWTLEDAAGRTLEHLLRVDLESETSVSSERVTRDGNYAFDTHAPALRGAVGRDDGGAIRAALRAKGKGNAETRSFSSRRSLLAQVAAGGRVDPGAIDDAHAIISALRAIVFLDIQPARMRDYRPEHAQAIGTSGENISPRLASLDAEELEAITDWLSELCSPALSAIAFDVTQLREVMFFLKEASGIQISARSVSDGTLRFLGLVTALLSAKPGSLIVLEEPDVGLHPARIHLLARLLEQVTQKPGIQVLATTHSPTLLAHLSPETLANVVALGRNEEGLSVGARLETLEHFAVLRDSLRLDHLISTGWIERAL